MTAHIITDLGYGDSGKGNTVDYLCRTINGNNIVIRTSGGHQIGHTVCKDGVYHEFHNFGSGTLQNVPTLYYKGTTMFPIHLLNELENLNSKFNNFKLPIQYYHPDVMVTTSFDVMANRLTEERRGTSSHGSVGLGFGNTIERSNKFKFTIFDILHSSEYVLRQKLDGIRNYYKSILPFKEFDNIDVDTEIRSYNLLGKLPINIITNIQDFINIYDNLIFEGNQGVLLDMDYGIYPHVTRCHTTAKPSVKFINKYLEDNIKINVYDISRIYHTRHGNGPFDESELDLINTENESNKNNQYQGKFKYSALNLNLLLRSISCNTLELNKCNSNNFYWNFIFTCCDQLYNIDEIPIFDIDSNEKKSVHINYIIDIIDLHYSYSNFYLNYSPTMELK